MPAAAIVAGTNIASGILGADAARDAAQTQAGAARNASALQRQTALDQIGAQAYATAPGRNVGTQALYQLASMLGIDPRTAFPDGWAASGGDGKNAMDPSSLIGQLPMPGAPGSEFGAFTRGPTLSQLQMDPSYQFRLDQNLGAIENSAAARGMQLSGSTLKDLSRFSQDFASQEYGNAYGRYMGQQNDQFNRLASLAGIGQSASQATGATAANALGNMGNQIGQNIIGAGNATAAGQVGAANAMGSSLNNMGNFAMFQSLFNQQPGGG
jgi:hypothetical protein